MLDLVGSVTNHCLKIKINELNICVQLSTFILTHTFGLGSIHIMTSDVFGIFLTYLKVSKSQKQIMKARILPKNEQNLLRILSWVNFIGFLEESETSYCAFEIYWPLPISRNVYTRTVSSEKQLSALLSNLWITRPAFYSLIQRGSTWKESNLLKFKGSLELTV